jgi:hypothetical protein
VTGLTNTDSTHRPIKGPGYGDQKIMADLFKRAGLIELLKFDTNKIKS